MTHELLVADWRRQPTDYQEFTHDRPRRADHQLDVTNSSPKIDTFRRDGGHLDEPGQMDQPALGAHGLPPRRGRQAPVAGVPGGLGQHPRQHVVRSRDELDPDHGRSLPHGLAETMAR